MTIHLTCPRSFPFPHSPLSPPPLFPLPHILLQIPFLKIYTEYVNNHQSALGIIDHLTAKNPDFKNFVERAQKDNQCNGLLLRDFLIDPVSLLPALPYYNIRSAFFDGEKVQRIPRYELLLKELLKNTPEDHPDHTPLETALEQVRNVATVLNEKHREQKSRTRVLEIKKLFGAGMWVQKGGER